ncbi:hypothetical protein BZA77DRAFT_356098 [Pyronema omphalodes]|nr:hypothetical protein BZA77DRAFT_356098 [Pyronema omphalodes]
MSISSTNQAPPLPTTNAVSAPSSTLRQSPLYTSVTFHTVYRRETPLTPEEFLFYSSRFLHNINTNNNNIDNINNININIPNPEKTMSHHHHRHHQEQTKSPELSSSENKKTASLIFNSQLSSSPGLGSTQMASSPPLHNPTQDFQGSLIPHPQTFAPAQHTVPAILPHDDAIFSSARNVLEKAEATINSELHDFDIYWKTELQIIRQTVQRMYTAGWVKPSP